MRQYSLLVLGLISAASCLGCGQAGERSDMAYGPDDGATTRPQIVEPAGDPGGESPATLQPPAESVVAPPVLFQLDVPPVIGPPLAQPTFDPPAAEPPAAEPPAQAMQSMAMQPRVFSSESPVKPRAAVSAIPFVVGPKSVAPPAPATGAATVAPSAEMQPFLGLPAPPESPVPAETDNGVFTRDENFTSVKVFYGTDRSRYDSDPPRSAASFRLLIAAFALATVTILIASIAMFVRAYRGLLYTGAGLGLAVTLLLAILVLQSPSGNHPAVRPTMEYTGGRGVMQYGECVVTIPLDHRLGQLEAPSVLKMEFAEKEEDHVTLAKVSPVDYEEFRTRLADTVSRSKRREVLVFVHGYNASFADAARRTGQIAYDLQFDGAPIFFSWPSQDTYVGYTVDENNVAWATPHLKKFLLDVARDSGAKMVHLVAHSMGNRALTHALRELALERPGAEPLFDQVVLAAPDVDAEIFTRDLAPEIVKAGKQVTLYASSNDRALMASKVVHGFPRAGDSGELLVLAPGIQTIDVSSVDTSLLGHSYYGSSNSILADLYFLLLKAFPAAQRSWLEPMDREGQAYWVFDKGRAALAIPQIPRMR
ncbi:alpha/beta hydrolase [Lignipirellula cremea]|uniref:Alpha/beta hydrolase family protein n=1 Tax=Lignipirellula cremea TaxID=2528010 RepID=A0A518DZC6_9BACT|nr:alpha/beta hydrolase [Lignipirellula cremea]QDU97189.1 hypothetical protein Pla8534_50340 [Lignipirellula cremea]